MQSGIESEQKKQNPTVLSRSKSVDGTYMVYGAQSYLEQCDAFKDFGSEALSASRRPLLYQDETIIPFTYGFWSNDYRNNYSYDNSDGEENIKETQEKITIEDFFQNKMVSPADDLDTARDLVSSVLLHLTPEQQRIYLSMRQREFINSYETNLDLPEYTMTATTINSIPRPSYMDKIVRKPTYTEMVRAKTQATETKKNIKTLPKVKPAIDMNKVMQKSGYQNLTVSRASTIVATKNILEKKQQERILEAEKIVSVDERAAVLFPMPDKQENKFVTFACDLSNSANKKKIPGMVEIEDEKENELIMKATKLVGEAKSKITDNTITEGLVPTLQESINSTNNTNNSYNIINSSTLTTSKLETSNFSSTMTDNAKRSSSNLGIGKVDKEKSLNKSFSGRRTGLQQKFIQDASVEKLPKWLWDNSEITKNIMLPKPVRIGMDKDAAELAAKKRMFFTEQMKEYSKELVDIMNGKKK